MYTFISYISRTEFRSRFISPILQRERTSILERRSLTIAKTQPGPASGPIPPAENRDRPESVTGGWHESRDKDSRGQNRRGINFFFGNSFAPGCASMPRKWPATAGSGRHVVNQEPRTKNEKGRKTRTTSATSEKFRWQPSN